MAIEQKFQTSVIHWLKSNGFYVIKTSAISGVPVGCPDIIALKNGFYVALEVKSSKNAPKQPLQQFTIDLLGKDGYAWFIYPENWSIIQTELETYL